MRKIAVALLAVMLVLSLAASVSGKETQKQNSTVEQSAAYSYTEYPLERNGIDLHLACMEATGMNPDRNILLIDFLHGKAMLYGAWISQDSVSQRK